MVPNLFGRSIRVFSRRYGRPSAKALAGQHVKVPFAKNVSRPFRSLPFAICYLAPSTCDAHLARKSARTAACSNKQVLERRRYAIPMRLDATGQGGQGGHSLNEPDQNPREAYQGLGQPVIWGKQGEDEMGATHDTAAGRTTSQGWASCPPSAQLLHPGPVAAPAGRCRAKTHSRHHQDASKAGLTGFALLFECPFARPDFRPGPRHRNVTGAAVVGAVLGIESAESASKIQGCMRSHPGVIGPGYSGDIISAAAVPVVLGRRMAMHGDAITRNVRCG